MSTSSSFVIDTYAWVEYLLGSKKGEAAKRYIEGDRGLTPSVVLAELRRWYLREIESRRRTGKEMQEHLTFVQTATSVVPLEAALALKAGETDFLMKKTVRNWPLADSIIYATARARGAAVVSGDPHFEGLEDVIFLT